MASRSLHIAVAQVHSGGPIADTLRRIDRQTAAAATVGAELILFAEGVLQGYDYDMTADLVASLAETADGPHANQVAAIARQHGLTVLAGFLERDGEQFFNSVLIAYPDGRRAVARKHALTAGEINAQLTPGPRQRTVVEINGVRSAVIICADGGIGGLHDDLRANQVDYRLCPTGGGGKLADMLSEADLDNEAGRQKYADNRPRVFNTQPILDLSDNRGLGFASANALGPVGRQTCHQGHCMIVDNRGVMRAQIPGTIVLEHMQDQMVHAKLNF